MKKDFRLKSRTITSLPKLSDDASSSRVINFRSMTQFSHNSLEVLENFHVPKRNISNNSDSEIVCKVTSSRKTMKVNFLQQQKNKKELGPTSYYKATLKDSQEIIFEESNSSIDRLACLRKVSISPDQKPRDENKHPRLNLKLLSKPDTNSQTSQHSLVQIESIVKRASYNSFLASQKRTSFSQQKPFKEDFENNDEFSENQPILKENVQPENAPYIANLFKSNQDLNSQKLWGRGFSLIASQKKVIYPTNTDLFLSPKTPSPIVSKASVISFFQAKIKNENAKVQELADYLQTIERKRKFLEEFLATKLNGIKDALESLSVVKEMLIAEDPHWFHDRLRTHQDLNSAPLFE